MTNDKDEVTQLLKTMKTGEPSAAERLWFTPNCIASPRRTCVERGRIIRYNPRLIHEAYGIYQRRRVLLAVDMLDDWFGLESSVLLTTHPSDQQKFQLLPLLCSTAFSSSTE